MPTLVIYLVGLTLLVCGAEVHGAFDCGKPFNPRDAKNCCKIPEPNWKAYDAECSQYTKNMFKGPSPCVFDCIFNTTQAIRNDEIIVENVRPILAKLYSDQAFVNGYLNGFTKCAPIMKQKIDEFKAGGPSSQKKPNWLNKQQCSPLALVYSMCAHKNLFIDCPASAWTSTPVCENAKEFIKNCDAMPGKKGGHRGLGNPARARGGL